MSAPSSPDDTAPEHDTNLEDRLYAAARELTRLAVLGQARKQQLERAQQAYENARQSWAEAKRGYDQLVDQAGAAGIEFLPDLAG